VPLDLSVNVSYNICREIIKGEKIMVDERDQPVDKDTVVSRVPRELVETLEDANDCPRCGKVCYWMHRHYSDDSVVSFDMCICGA